MRHLGLLVAITAALTACATPSPSFRAEVATRLTVSGEAFKVWVRDGQAEAVRISFRPLRLGRTPDEAFIRAIETASGCTVARGRVESDGVLATARLTCPDG
jgi:hypothetical protein